MNGPGPHLTCVVVDDHDAVRGAVRSQLERIDWVDVVAEAANGSDGIACIERERPDVAIVDVRMPDMSGFDVCAAVVARSSTRVVLYTALGSAENARLAREVGAHALVAKDDGFSPLAACLDDLRQALRHDQGAATSLERG